MEIPGDPASRLLSIYSRNMKTLVWKDVCTPVFIAALFTVVKIWEQPECPSTDEWMDRKDVVCVCIHTSTHIYTHMDDYSAIKNEILPRYLESMVLSEMSDGGRHTLCDFTHVWNIKYKQNKWTDQIKQNTEVQEESGGSQRGGGVGGGWNG